MKRTHLLAGLLLIAGANGPALAEKPTAAPGGDRSVELQTKDYQFDYFYPAAAARVPALRNWLEADLVKQKRAIIKFATEEKRNAREGGYDYNQVYISVGWSTVTDLPGWISLLASVESYEGGAHPNHAFDSLLWDKQAGRARAVSDLFVSGDALRKAIRGDFCREIDKQREEKRGEKIRPGGDDPFEVCIDPLESTVILGSSTRQAFDRIGVVVAPYAAGPYVEGDYEVTLPVTAKLLALVRPQYRKFFAVKR